MSKKEIMDLAKLVAGRSGLDKVHESDKEDFIIMCAETILSIYTKLNPIVKKKYNRKLTKKELVRLAFNKMRPTKPTPKIGNFVRIKIEPNEDGTYSI
jgi:hypothetical protein